MFLKKLLSEWLLLGHYVSFPFIHQSHRYSGKKVTHLGIIANSSNYQSKTHYLLSQEKAKTF